MINTEVLDALQDTTDSDFVAELIDTYLDDCPALLDSLRQALADGDAEAFRRAAHSLKSNSATLGAEALADTARALEMKGKAHELGKIGAEVEAAAVEFDGVREVLEAYKHAHKR